MEYSASHRGDGANWRKLGLGRLIFWLCFTSVVHGQAGWPSDGSAGGSYTRPTTASSGVSPPAPVGGTGAYRPARPGTGSWGTGGGTGSWGTGGGTGSWGTGGTGGGTGSWGTGTPSRPTGYRWSGSTRPRTGGPTPPSVTGTTSPPFTDCGGIYSSPTGNLTSPGFPGVYPGNAYCIYHVTRDAERHNETYLSFIHFSLESHSSCHWDGLEIYSGSVNFDDDGNTVLSQPLLRLCGYEPQNIVIPSAEFTMVFRSDRSISGDGFLVHYGDEFLNVSIPQPGGNGTAVEGCGGLFGGVTGIISSPNYPDAYPNNLDCVYIIQRNTTAATTLEFLDFDVESHFQCMNDYVKVYIGANPYGRLMRTFCGSPTANFTTSATVMTVVFRTNSYARGNGFRIRYTDAVGNDSQPIACGGNYTGSRGEITSPGYPDDYPHNVYCVYSIHRNSTNNSRNTQLTFPEFDLQYSFYSCLFDFLMIIDGNASSGNLMASYCGNDVNSITTSSNEITLVFSTDGSVTRGGFRIAYQDTEVLHCGGIFTNESGQISSPNYPNAYPNHVYCVYTINRGFVGSIALQFYNFTLEGHYTCLYNYLAIYNGTMEDALLVNVCGNQTYDMVIANTSTVTLVFSSDHSVARDGWLIRYGTNIPNATTNGTIGCDSYYGGISGEIRSPRYPNNYPHQSRCTYTIHRNSSLPTLITFEYFDLESSSGCVYDYVKVYNGNATGTPVNTFCGSRTEDVQIDGNVVTLVFVSDRSISGGGFRIMYEDGENRTPMCGGNFSDNSGEITSPNWPQVYHHRAYCAYHIHRTGRDNWPTRVQFLDFSLEQSARCTWDYVQIYEGSLVSSNLVQTYCGTFAPDIYINGHNFVVVFVSDSSVAAKGFRMHYSAYRGTVAPTFPTRPTTRYPWSTTPYPWNTTPNNLRCGRTSYYQNSGMILSPNFPANYGNNMDCVYTIRRYTNTSTLLRSVNFTLEGSGYCSYDSLKVFSGSPQGGDIMGTYCGSSDIYLVIPNDYVSLTFVTDSSVTRSGFNISFGDAPGSTTTGRPFSTGYPGSCGGNFGGIAGSISSPNYPRNYFNNMDCMYVINRASTVPMALQLKVFILEDGNHCQYDFVQVLEGSVQGGREVTKLCGERADTIITSNYVTLRFVTDSSNTEKGFYITYGDAAGCKEGQSMCRDESACFSQWQHCNGIADCVDGSDEYACSSPSTGSQNLLMIPLTVVGLILLVVIIMVAVGVGVCYHRRRLANGRAEPSASFAVSPATATLGMPPSEAPMPAMMPNAPPIPNATGGYDNPLYSVAGQNGTVDPSITKAEPLIYESVQPPVDSNMKAYLIEPKEHGTSET